MVKPLLIILFVLYSTVYLYGQDIQQIGKGKPFSITGALNLGSAWNFTNAASSPYNKSSYNINCSPTLNFYSFSLPFTIYYTNNSSGFNHPFNRIGVSPTYKWLKVHLGYRSINVSPYVMSGKIMLGGGLELTPGRLRFAVLGGRLEKAQEEDTLAAKGLPPTYERYGCGGKIGAGASANSYIDLFFFQGRDVLKSLATPVKSDVHPAENIAGGFALSSPIGKRFVWVTTVAFSFYTRDVYARNDDSLNKLSRYFENDYIHLNFSSQYLTAGESFLRYNGSGGSFTFKYKRIDPDYKTMATFYQQSDISEYSLLFNRGLFKNKISLSGNFSTSEDNIYRARNTLTTRNSGGLMIGYNGGGKLTMELNLLAFNLYQSYLHNPVGDSLKLNQLNKMISGGIHYTIDKPLTSNVISVGAGYNGSSNLNPEYIYDYSTLNTNYNVSFSTLLKGSKISVSEIVSMNINTSRTTNVNSKTFGENLGKAWAKDKLNTNLSVSYTSSSLNGAIYGSSINLQGGISLRPNKNNTLGLNGGIVDNIAVGKSGVWFSTFNIRYTLNFNQFSPAKKNVK